MTDVQLPQALVDKAVEAMVTSMLKDGISYSLREAIESTIKKRMLESGIVDDLANAVIERVLSDRDAIAAQAGDAIIAGLGEALGTAYKTIARKFAEHLGKYRF